MSFTRPPNPADRYQRRYGDPAPVPASQPKTGSRMGVPNRSGRSGLRSGAPDRPGRGLRPSRPNAAIEAAYRRKLDRLIAEMHGSIMWFMRAAYRQHEPVLLAMDGGNDDDARIWDDLCAGIFDGIHRSGADSDGVVADFPPSDNSGFAFDRRTPAEFLRDAFAKLAKRWTKRFDDAGPRLARWFATAAADRSDGQLRHILRQGGFSVRFQMTPAARDIIDATVQANVALIRSIPEQYLTQVEGIVFRSVQTGRDLGQLSKDLQEQFGVTKRRAALIARSQNNLATTAITKARHLELGIEEGIWMHSHAGEVPRPKHLAADGKRFNIREGLPVGDKGEWQMPGEAINCRCTWRPVIVGFT